MAPSRELELNAAALGRETAWFERVLEARLALYFGHETDVVSIEDIGPPDLSHDPSVFAREIRRLGLSRAERLVLILSLVPHIRPQLLDTFFVQNKTFARGFTEFGGVTGSRHGGFLPTGETAAFLLAGDDMGLRFDMVSLFDGDHNVRDILYLDGFGEKEPALSRPLVVSPAFLQKITTGRTHRPEYGMGFPAKRLTSALCWEDLVLPPEALAEVEHILGWVRYGEKIMDVWGLARVIKPGFRALFHGPPGTGKTLTASLIGGACDMDVYRIDLSMMVSKYIGETEKNLAGVFDQAEHRHWILFFDEADALFGKRTQATSSNDRHANQEIAYLLQRIEDFPGLVILATNMKANLDEAFFRRFQSAVYFPIPDGEQRSRIWERALVGMDDFLDEKLDLPRLAHAHVLSGGAIVNVIRFGAVEAMNAGRGRISMADLEARIRRELQKEGKTW